jgi:hypothetical protein
VFKAWSVPGSLTGNGTSLVDIRANSKYDRKKELELLPGHGLQIHTIIMGLNRETLTLQPISKRISEVVGVLFSLFGMARPKNSW